MTTPNVERTPGSLEQHLTAKSLVLLQELSISFSDLMQNLELIIDSASTNYLNDLNCDAYYEEIFIIEDIRDCIAVIRASPFFEHLRVSGKTHEDFLVYWWKLERLAENWDSNGEDRDRYNERGEMGEIVIGIGDSELGGSHDDHLVVGNERGEVPRASSRWRTDPNHLWSLVTMSLSMLFTPIIHHRRLFPAVDFQGSIHTIILCEARFH